MVSDIDYIWDIRPAILTDDRRPVPQHDAVNVAAVELGMHALDALRDSVAEAEAAR